MQIQGCDSASLLSIETTSSVALEPLSFSDLKNLGSSPQSVKEAFATIFKKQPDGISVNSETYFNAVKPAITEQYGHPCYKDVGEFIFTKLGTSDEPSAVAATTFAVNEGNEDADISVTLTGSVVDTLGWSTSVTEGLSVSVKFTIEKVFEMGATASVSATQGSSGSQATTRAVTVTVKVPVPARSQRKVTLIALMKKESYSFVAPITVNGDFGANFPDRVQGKYFWFVPATDVLNSTTGKITGKISNAWAFDSQIKIDKAEPLPAKPHPTSSHASLS